MNINKMHKSTSKYPKGYIKKICKTYQKNDLALKEIAQGTPDEDIDKANVTDMIEFRLLRSQEKLLELGAKYSNFKYGRCHRYARAVVSNRNRNRFA